MNKNQLRPGDRVRVKSSAEIQKTLDSKGCLDQLVFMPEMARLGGQTFRVFRRATHVVTDGAPVGEESRVRAFINNDVVILENVRCPGLQHDGCKRGCMIFWKETWLEKVTENQTPAASPAVDLVLPTQKEAGTYYCQSSELLKATLHQSARQRITNVFSALAAGNYTIMQMTRMLVVWVYRKLHRKLFGEWPAGTLEETPAEALGLQPGEWVEVKSLAEILKTLDREAKNRGLHFSADMPPYCGKRFRVSSRADKLIAEGTGKMRQLRNTVTLEGSVCDSAIFSLGGCPREDLLYWREIWLKRVEGAVAGPNSSGAMVDQPKQTAVEMAVGE